MVLTRGPGRYLERRGRAHGGARMSSWREAPLSLGGDFEGAWAEIAAFRRTGSGGLGLEVGAGRIEHAQVRARFGGHVGQNLDADHPVLRIGDRLARLDGARDVLALNHPAERRVF